MALFHDSPSSSSTGGSGGPSEMSDNGILSPPTLSSCGSMSSFLGVDNSNRTTNVVLVRINEKLHFSGSMSINWRNGRAFRVSDVLSTVVPKFGIRFPFKAFVAEDDIYDILKHVSVNELITVYHNLCQARSTNVDYTEPLKSMITKWIDNYSVANGIAHRDFYILCNEDQDRPVQGRLFSVAEYLVVIERQPYYLLGHIMKRLAYEIFVFDAPTAQPQSVTQAYEQILHCAFNFLLMLVQSKFVSIDDSCADALQAFSWIYQDLLYMCSLNYNFMYIWFEKKSWLQPFITESRRVGELLTLCAPGFPDIKLPSPDLTFMRWTFTKGQFSALSTGAVYENGSVALDKIPFDLCECLFREGYENCGKCSFVVTPVAQQAAAAAAAVAHEMQPQMYYGQMEGQGQGQMNAQGQAQFNAPTEAEHIVPAETQYNVANEAQNIVPAEVQYNAPTEVQSNFPTEAQYNAPTETQYNVANEAQNIVPAEVQYNAPTQAQYIVLPEAQNNFPTEAQNNFPTEVHNNVPSQVQSNFPTEVQNTFPTEVQHNAPTVADFSAPMNVQMEAQYDVSSELQYLISSDADLHALMNLPMDPIFVASPDVDFSAPLSVQMDADFSPRLNVPTDAHLRAPMNVQPNARSRPQYDAPTNAALNTPLNIQIDDQMEEGGLNTPVVEYTEYI